MPISLNTLKNRAVIIRDEVLSAKNTATRVGSLFYDLIDKVRGYEADFHAHTNKTVLDQLTDSMGTNTTQAGGKLKYRGQIIESTPSAISTWISTPVDRIVDVLPTTPDDGSRFILSTDGRIYVYASLAYTLDPQTDPETATGSAVIVRTDENEDLLNHIFIYENSTWVDRDVDYNQDSTKFITQWSQSSGRSLIQIIGSPDDITQAGLYWGKDNVVGSPLYDVGGALFTNTLYYTHLSQDGGNAIQTAVDKVTSNKFERVMSSGSWGGWGNTASLDDVFKTTAEQDLVNTSITLGVIDLYEKYYVKSISCPNLVSCDVINITQRDSPRGLLELNLPVLTTAINIDVANTRLSTLDLSSLSSVGDIIGVSYNNLLSTLDLSSLTSVEHVFGVSYNESLTNISISNSLNCLFIGFLDNALTETCVDDILDKIDQAGYENGTLSLNGGTNAIPSAAGLVSKASLEGKGWTVTVNS